MAAVVVGRISTDGSNGSDSQPLTISGVSPTRWVVVDFGLEAPGVGHEAASAVKRSGSPVQRPGLAVSGTARHVRRPGADLAPSGASVVRSASWTESAGTPHRTIRVPVSGSALRDPAHVRRQTVVAAPSARRR